MAKLYALRDPDLEPPKLMVHPELGELMNTDGIIALMRDATSDKGKAAYRAYRKELRRMDGSGLSGSDLRAKALFAALGQMGIPITHRSEGPANV